MVLLYDRTFLAGSLREAWRRRRPLYVGLAATWILLGILLVQSFRVRSVNSISRDVAPWQYFLTQPGVVAHYLWLSIWPHPLCFDYFGWPIVRTWASALLPALALGIVAGCLVWGLLRNSGWAFLGAWFVLILAPSSSFITLDSPAYEHRMYLPLAAVLVAAVLGIQALFGKRAVVLYASLAIGLVFLTWRRNEDYRSEFSIWADTVPAKRPGNARRAQSNLGTALGHLAGPMKRLRIGHEHCRWCLTLRNRTTDWVWFWRSRESFPKP